MNALAICFTVLGKKGHETENFMIPLTVCNIEMYRITETEWRFFTMGRIGSDSQHQILKSFTPPSA